MNDFLKWIKENLPLKEEVLRVLKIGDKVSLIQRDKHDPNVYTFLGYKSCKWVHYYDQPNSCFECKGKFSVENTKTKKVSTFCGTFSVRKTDYAKIKILEQDLPEELFEI